MSSSRTIKQIGSQVLSALFFVNYNNDLTTTSYFKVINYFTIKAQSWTTISEFVIPTTGNYIILWQAEFSDGGQSASCTQAARYRVNTNADIQFVNMSIVNMKNCYSYHIIDSFNENDAIRLQLYCQVSKNITNQKIAVIKLYSNL